MKNVFLTKKETAFENYLFDVFIREGYNVYTPGENTDEKSPCEAIDIFIDTSNEKYLADTFCISDGLNEEIIEKTYRKNVIKPMEMLEKYLPLLDKGETKRLCYLSSAEASINETKDTTGYAYKMSKAAMHNFIQMVSNRLSPSGYTFRVLDPLPGKQDDKLSAEAAFNYITRPRGNENNDPLRNDENRITLRNTLGTEHPW